MGEEERCVRGCGGEDGWGVDESRGGGCVGELGDAAEWVKMREEGAREGDRDGEEEEEDDESWISR